VEDDLDLMINMETSMMIKDIKPKSSKDKEDTKEEEITKEEDDKQNDKDVEIERMKLEIQDLREELEEVKVLNEMDMEDITIELDHTKLKVKQLEEKNQILEDENQRIFEKYMNLEDDYNRLIDSYDVNQSFSKPKLTKDIDLPPPIRRDSRPEYIDGRKLLERHSSFNSNPEITPDRKFPSVDRIPRTRSLTSYKNDRHPLNKKKSNSLNLNINTARRVNPKPSSILMLCDILPEDELDDESEGEMSS